MDKLFEYLTKGLREVSEYPKDWGFFTLINGYRLFYDFDNGLKIWLRKEFDVIETYEDESWVEGGNLKEPIKKLLKGVTFTEEEIEEYLNKRNSNVEN